MEPTWRAEPTACLGGKCQGVGMAEDPTEDMGGAALSQKAGQAGPGGGFEAVTEGGKSVGVAEIRGASVGWGAAKGRVRGSGRWCEPPPG